MTRNRAVAVAALVLGVAAAVGVPVTWWATRPTASVAASGALPSSLATLAAPSTGAPATPSTTAGDTGLAAAASSAGDDSVAGPVPVQDGTIPTGGAAVTPASVSLPRLGLRAPVDAVGVDPNGVVEIPHDVRRLGWYRYSAAPTDGSGPVTLVGHRDSRTQGDGVLYGLGDARPGDRVLLTLSNGQVQQYRVVERRLYLKKVLPLRLIFERTGPRRLLLVTCGGPYDRAHGGYQDNLVVTAVPD